MPRRTLGRYLNKIYDLGKDQDELTDGDDYIDDDSLEISSITDGVNS